MPQAKPKLTQVVVPQHFIPPSPRELRAHAVQRLQVGLFGLAAMLLLVGLANIIMDRARLAEADVAPDESAMVTESAKKAASDPLADIGVIPAADPSSAATRPPN